MFNIFNIINKPDLTRTPTTSKTEFSTELVTSLKL